MRIMLLAAVSIPALAAAASPVPRQVPVTVTTVSADQLNQLPTGRALADLVSNLRCGNDIIPTVRPLPPPGVPIDGLAVTPPPGAPATSMLSCVRPVDVRMIDIYRGHNIARARVGAAPLVWDEMLAAGAAPYALTMAQTGQFVHSPREGRRFVRENLASTPHGWSGAQIVGRWAAEQRFFVPGIFPNVSSTGDWNSVAHYTQMIWPTTNRLGCAISTGSGFDWIVCRYSPPGNRDGSYVIPPPAPTPPPPP